MRWVIALDSISCRSFCNAEISCQVRSDLDDPTDKQVIKKLPLNPYLSRIGSAFVNCDLRVSPKVSALADFHNRTNMSTLRRQILDEVRATGGFKSSCLDNLSVLADTTPESESDGPSPLMDNTKPS